MVGLQRVLIQVTGDLRQLQQRWALVGGLAVSARSEPRTTRDLDVAVAVSDDQEAEALVADMRSRGYVLLNEAVPEDIAEGRALLSLIVKRGNHRGKDIQQDLEEIIAAWPTTAAEPREGLAPD